MQSGYASPHPTGVLEALLAARQAEEVHGVLDEQLPDRRVIEHRLSRHLGVARPREDLAIVSTSTIRLYGEELIGLVRNDHQERDAHLPKPLEPPFDCRVGAL